jgi:hypothetical protein
MSENVPKRSRDRVTITVIIVAGAIILTGIVSCAVIATAFFLNPPW